MSLSRVNLVFSLGALVLFVIAILHILSSVYSLYFIWPWFDIPMHILGGAFLGFIFYSFFWSKLRKFRSLSQMRRGVLVLAAVLIVGSGWELFEFVLDFVVHGSAVLQTSPQDTGMDFIFDTIGALAAFAVSRMIMRLEDNT